MPIPVSATSTATRSSARARQLTRTEPPSGVYLIALSIRLSSDLADGLLVGQRPASRSSSAPEVEGQVEVLGRRRGRGGVSTQSSSTGTTASGWWSKISWPRLEPGQAEQVEDQLVEPLGLLVDPLEEPDVDVLVVEGPVEEGLGIGLDRGQRRLELVRGVGDEVLPHPLQAAELGDVVEDQDGARRGVAGQRGAVHRQEPRLAAERDLAAGRGRLAR